MRQTVERLLSKKQVREIVGLSYAQMARMEEAEPPKFPRRVRLTTSTRPVQIPRKRNSGLGHQYYYWQKTYRVGRQVKTLNCYIGPVGKVPRPIGPRPIAPVVVTPTRIPTLSEARTQIGRLGGYANIDKMPLAQQNAYVADELASSFGLNAEYWYKHATENNIALLPYLHRIDAEEDFDKRRAILNEALDVVAGIKNPAPVITHPDLTGATTIPIPFPVRINKSVVEFALKAVTGDVSTTDMDQAWRVKSVNAEIERRDSQR